MIENSNPIEVKGERNVFCPHYRDCLNYASKNYWECWACQDCPHNNETEAAADVMLSPGNADLYYSLSPTLYQKVRGFSI